MLIKLNAVSAKLVYLTIACERDSIFIHKVNATSPSIEAIQFETLKIAWHSVC